MSSRKSLVNKLIEFYNKYENHFPNVAKDDLVYYFRNMLAHDKIILEFEGDEILGIVTGKLILIFVVEFYKFVN